MDSSSMRSCRRLSLRRALIPVVALGLAAMGCGAPRTVPPGPPPASASATPEPTAAVEPPPPSTLAWAPCGPPFECANLDVPLDHAAPDGPMVRLALIRLPAPSPAHRIGSLVVNPGGPGGSGVEFVRAAAVETIPAELRARFDVVGFDPRGVGASAGIACSADAVARFATGLVGDTGEALAGAEALARACAAAGDPLAHMGTAAVADDLDLLRAALGDRRLTYLGYSYGTLIGALYAERHPDRVRALVLDGAVDPAQDVAAKARDKALATEWALEDFLAWCSTEPACDLHATAQDPRAAVDGVLASLPERPAPPAGALDGPLPRSVALFVMSALLTDREHGWPVLAAGLALQAVEGDGSLLLAVFDGFRGGQGEGGNTSFELAQLMAVNCLDVPAPPAADLPSLVAAQEALSPRFGALALLSWAPCSYWPFPSSRAAAPVSAIESPPLVVIGTRGDAVTPYSWSEALAGQLHSAVLFTRDGDTHTAFGGANVCTDRAIMRYLLEEVPPAEGMACG